jgi:hypothetical protein
MEFCKFQKVRNYSSFICIIFFSDGPPLKSCVCIRTIRNSTMWHSNVGLCLCISHTHNFSLYDLQLSRRLNSMKFSRAISCVKCLYETDISRAISVLLIRDLLYQMVLETSVSYRHLTRLSSYSAASRKWGAIYCCNLC